MPGRESRIANRANDSHTRANSLFNQTTQRISQVRLLKIATRRDVDDTNVVLVLVRQHPTQTRFDVAFRDAPALADLDQHDLRFRRDAAVQTIRQMSVARTHD